MTTRNINKQLAAMEDLAQGIGTTNQVRGGIARTVHRIDVPVAVETQEEMEALDVEKFTRARVYSTTTSFTDYIYDVNATSGITSTGPGFWLPSLNKNKLLQFKTVNDAVNFQGIASISGEMVLLVDRNAWFEVVLSSSFSGLGLGVDELKSTANPDYGLYLFVDENTQAKAFGLIGSGIESSKFLRAKQRCKDEGVALNLKGGVTYDVGNSTFEVSIIKEKIVGVGGVATLRASSLPSQGFCRLVGEYERTDSLSYTERHLANHNVLENIALIGDETTPHPVNGFVIGDGVHVTSLFSCKNLSVSGFETIEFKDESWAFKLENFHTKHCGLITPVSPVDYGENITFVAPFIADSPDRDLIFNSGEYTIIGGSIDSTTIVTNGVASVKWVDGHLENPRGNQPADKTYVYCNGQSSFTAHNLEIVTNEPITGDITEPWFMSAEGNRNGIDITGCKYTQQPYYRPDLGNRDGRRVLVGGKGRVVCDNAKINAYDNFTYIPVSPSVGLQNGDFEVGVTKAWNKTGTGTIATDVTEFKIGTQSAKFTATSGNQCVLENKIPCKRLDKLTGGLWYKTDLRGNGTLQFQLSFYDSFDQLVQSGASFFSTTSDVDWTWQRFGFQVPDGSTYVILKIEVSYTAAAGSDAIGWYDGIVLNSI